MDGRLRGADHVVTESDTTYATYRYPASSATYEILATCENLWHVPVSGSSVGEFIRERRLARGWSQRKLAAELGPPITREQISRWENDKHAPGPTHAAALARALGGDADEFRGLSGAPRRLRDLVEELMSRVEQLERRTDRLEKR
jgi:transcriptional regulator with XRE-family HTH domain